MLHFVYGLRGHGISAEYNAEYAYLALKGFLKEIGRDEEYYLHIIRDVASRMYKAALQGTGKNLFLDKGPRYYFIIPELYRIFPKAKFVFLIRNPLAVFASILSVNFKGDPRGFLSEDRRHDILTAPRLILGAIKNSHGKTAVVHYEKLASNPDKTVRDLCVQMELDYDPDMLNYGGKVRLAGSFVDPKSIYEHSAPVNDYVAKWPQYLDSSDKVEMARAYLRLLGRDVVEGLGYSYSEIELVLNRLRAGTSAFTLPWDRLLADGYQLSAWDRCKLSFLGTFGHRTARKILRHYKRQVVRGLG
jgi:hypothetical protein